MKKKIDKQLKNFTFARKTRQLLGQNKASFSNY